MQRYNYFAFLIIVLLFSCSEQQARKPISQSSGTFIKESIERNKKLNASEEISLQNYMKKDSSNSYLSSSKGFWYKYIKQISSNEIKPKRGDFAFFNYEIKDLNDVIIYSKDELKTKKYLVDKENIMSGIREGIKLMKKGETVTFLFPSHVAYGYHGDNDKIGTNIPVVCTISLIEIEKDPNASEN